MGVLLQFFWTNILSTEFTNERCGEGNLFAVFTIERNSGSENDWLVIVEGGLNREAWRVDLGETSNVKSTPGIVDINGDGFLKLLLPMIRPLALKLMLGLLNYHVRKQEIGMLTNIQVIYYGHTANLI